MASTICGWCGDRTHMTMVQDPYELPRTPWEQRAYMAAFQCSNERCARLSVGWADLDVRSAAEARVQLPRIDLEWEPSKIRRPRFPDVPEEIADAASEAHACLSIQAARGAVALARAVVEATAKAKGITSGQLVQKINKLHEQGVISKLTAETSHAIRDDGNSIAHGDLGDEPMSQADAEAVVKFMDTLLDEVFQRPATLKRLKQRHLERKNGSHEPQSTAQPARGGGDFSAGPAGRAE